MSLSLDRWVGKVAIVTGASSGIGAAVVEKLVDHGILVVGLARRMERLQEQAKKLSNKKGKLYPIKCDLTKEEQIISAFKWTKENLGTVQILVNSAGVKIDGNLWDGSVESWKTVLDTNVIALCTATREAVKQLKADNSFGQIIHINSVLGHYIYDIPELNVYPASQFAVTALTESLRFELLNMNTEIKVTSISPGPVATDFFGPAGPPKAIKKFLLPEDIANGVEYVLSTPPHVQVAELTLRPLNEPL